MTFFSASLNDEMKKKRKENPLVLEVADILVQRVRYSINTFISLTIYCIGGVWLACSS